ncbi:MAG: hypothetical protein P8Y52_08310 [Xanthomonadales bacterium]
MPRSKKTRTRSTDRAASRQLRRLQQARMGVAAEAARIIATEGQPNYHSAKKKAAERIGVSDRLALPSNIEVKEALFRYLDLYGGEAHDENLLALRRTAVQAMRLLEEFNPRLVGSVLDGTAGPHTRVALHLFAESSETVILFFRDRGIPFSQEQRQIRWFNGEHRPIELIVTELDGRTLELAVFEPVHLRQAPPSPIDGKPQRRAALPEVELVLAEQDA